jgi:hypothetical protein
MLSCTGYAEDVEYNSLAWTSYKLNYKVLTEYVKALCDITSGHKLDILSLQSKSVNYFV